MNGKSGQKFRWQMSGSFKVFLAWRAQKRAQWAQHRTARQVLIESYLADRKGKYFLI
jgi:hypothetical protein